MGSFRLNGEEGAADKRQPKVRKRRGREVPLVREMPFIKGSGMTHRDAKLQLFYDFTETAIHRRVETCANSEEAAKPVFGALRTTVGGQSDFASERLPVCDALEFALRLAGTGPAPIPELAAALDVLSPRLQWKRRDASTPDGTTFHDGHANALSRGRAVWKSATTCGSVSACWRLMYAILTIGIARKRFMFRWPVVPGGIQIWNGPRQARVVLSTTNPMCCTPCEPTRSRCWQSGVYGWGRVRNLLATPPAHENDRRPCNGARRRVPVSASG